MGEGGSFYQEKGGHGGADGQEPAGGVGQDCAQGEELFGGEREAGGVDTMLEIAGQQHIEVDGEVLE